MPCYDFVTYKDASYENTAVANVTTWTRNPSFVGYATFTQQIGADHVVASLFVSNQLPKTSYSIRIVDGKHCSDGPSFDPQINNATYLEIGDSTNDVTDYIISKPTPLDVSIVGSPKSEKYILQKTILFVDMGSHEALACGQILPKEPFANTGHMRKSSIYISALFFLVLFFSIM
uniref:Uncharacterized protein n=1 Tax=Romanomermis culicivorax TaxID=13658 RepID=A0A915HJ41_ROMCU